MYIAKVAFKMKRVKEKGEKIQKTAFADKIS